MGGGGLILGGEGAQHAVPTSLPTLKGHKGLGCLDHSATTTSETSQFELLRRALFNNSSC